MKQVKRSVAKHKYKRKEYDSQVNKYTREVLVLILSVPKILGRAHLYPYLLSPTCDVYLSRVGGFIRPVFFGFKLNSNIMQNLDITVF